MTGSVVMPIKAVVMNVLSLGASFGALKLDLPGRVTCPGCSASTRSARSTCGCRCSILIFAFGLSMDYEVFLLSRIKEVHDQTGDNDTAVAVGLQRSGRIITSAAALIVVVFAGFAAGEVLAVKQLGVGLAIAVIVDATLVRMLLVPATMSCSASGTGGRPRRCAASTTATACTRPPAPSAAQRVPTPQRTTTRSHSSPPRSTSRPSRPSDDRRQPCHVGQPSRCHPSGCRRQFGSSCSPLSTGVCWQPGD